MDDPKSELGMRLDDESDRARLVLVVSRFVEVGPVSTFDPVDVSETVPVGTEDPVSGRPDVEEDDKLETGEADGVFEEPEADDEPTEGFADESILVDTSELDAVFEGPKADDEPAEESADESMLVGTVSRDVTDVFVGSMPVSVPVLDPDITTVDIVTGRSELDIEPTVVCPVTSELEEGPAPDVLDSSGKVDPLIEAVTVLVSRPVLVLTLCDEVAVTPEPECVVKSVYEDLDARMLEDSDAELLGAAGFVLLEVPGLIVLVSTDSVESELELNEATVVKLSASDIEEEERREEAGF